ncbi:MAG: Trm112 family protein [Promethearchaeota archaeon]|jgi:uncharacterized protein YbaR (Trm112 family)
MKPWLFDILACPIDKYFPLKLYIFSFETKSKDFLYFIETYEKRDLSLINKEEIIKVVQKEGNIFVKDNIVIEKTKINDYINLIVLSIKELDNIFTRTKDDIGKRCFELIGSRVRPKILEFSMNKNLTQLNDILPELFFLNKIKSEVEIETGLLYCKNCNRWYPIIETIPQMLPDEYRYKEKEIEFLQNHKNLLDEEFLNQDLKPFNV